MPDAITVARAQGLFNVVGGMWPVLSLRSFEAIYGAKTDRWLQRTNGALLAATGISLLLARPGSEGMRHARCVGTGSALTLLAADVVYVPLRRIPATYLLDAAMEAAWLTAWWTVRIPRTRSGFRRTASRPA
ncbi:hypothetical protein [Streptomyces sp. NPDC127092]|uniref:hypothetical protein n=1 Tax=Streptomyces sp. NPDC127092 TaxID=3347135 RepID=UPI003660462B